MALELDNNEIQKALLKLGEYKKISPNASVTAGWKKGTTYPNGTEVFKVALTNEYGALIKIKTKERNIYHSIDEDGNFLNDGKFSKRKDANLERTITIEAHNIHIPARPFVKPAFTENKIKWEKVIQEAFKFVLEGKLTLKQALERLGTVMRTDIQKQINTLHIPPSALSTIRKKEAEGKKNPNKPLIDTGRMLQTVTFVIDLG